MTRIVFITLLFLGFITSNQAQKPVEQNAVDIYNQIEKLRVLGSVLYIAAHPDDENTRLISYFSNERKVRTAYLSLTRGDGGQNLIGTEIWEQLGLIRTNELLRARSVDGGQQFFSRANDFGYSKHPDETLAFWNKEEVMHDIIKVIREFKPDIIVNRFDHNRAGRTHGHHTSSAILSVEAFDIAGNPEFMPERLGHLAPWQPERVMWNTGWWWYGSRENFENADKSKLAYVDAGVYFPERGISNTEIAARSRTMHKSQGFGSTGTRGSEMEYMELIKGSLPEHQDDPLSGIDISWNKVKGGQMIDKKIGDILQHYDFTNPASHIPALLAIYDLILEIDDPHWKKIKSQELKDIVVSSLGLFLEAKSETPYAVPGSKVTIQFEMINRSDVPVQVVDIAIEDHEVMEVKTPLPQNEQKIQESQLTVASDKPYSNPYWLDQPGSLGMYHVENESMIGTPVSEPAYTVSFRVSIGEKLFEVKRPLIYKRNDPVDGEVYTPFYIMPPVSVGFSDPIFIFADREPKEINVQVKSYTDNLNGILSLDHPSSWIVSPKVMDISLAKDGEEKTVTFTVKGPVLAESAKMTAKFMTADGAVHNQSVIEIDYDHIPKQVLVKTAEAKFERLSIQTKGKEIAYLQGAGDNIPRSLRQIGYNVTEITTDDVRMGNLDQYDAVVMGIRAYNTKEELLLKKEALTNYMENGGTVVVQYNTSRGVNGDEIAPYPMELSRDRVTDELAKVTFIDPDHEVLNAPNKISSRDFEGWVQERGLYFPNKWDEKFAAPLACNDPGEESRQGGLLIAEVGKGHFIYTGYSWFRQLPAGVPGAFRLFANLLSIGKNDLTQSSNTTGGNE